ncbi:MalY/PatB family protein [Aestuariibaculum suncheonense]|uniref:cysteine-S-conjugate beta-lyase n=1 Tax=Aestuariibaculum suncheonense TaxID=1028745 RepID=A0A8J6UBC4_9FLAO|nr:PatB family C-S lyase [Aestuariibaculum suncheonense]MBD0835785.1 putative C-S lyase [Aestuariibaculum suncheonense]
MSIFDIEHTVENYFVKNNPKYLKMVLGTDDVMPLWIADMDFKVASPITEALRNIVERGIYAYEDISPQVKEAMANWNLKRHGLQMNPNAFIQVNGVLTAIAVILRALTKESDGIMIQTPVYHQFYNAIKTANRTVIENPLKIENGHYAFDFEHMEQQLKSGNTKMILLCNPHNPVGRVWCHEELQKLVDLANQYNVIIVSDEVHSEIVFSKTKFNSILSLENIENHIAVLGSPAKTFGMQSIANGYIYAENKAQFEVINSLVTSMYLHQGGALSAYAILAAYTSGHAWVDELVLYLEETVNWIEDFLKTELPQVKMIRPEGTYQVWLDFSALNLNKTQLKALVFNKAKVGLALGSTFGADYELFMRMNIASPLAKIQQAFQRIKAAIDSL